MIGESDKAEIVRRSRIGSSFHAQFPRYSARVLEHVKCAEWRVFLLSGLLVQAEQTASIPSKVDE